MASTPIVEIHCEPICTKNLDCHHLNDARQGSPQERLALSQNIFPTLQLQMAVSTGTEQGEFDHSYACAYANDLRRPDPILRTFASKWPCLPQTWQSGQQHLFLAHLAG